MMKPRSLLRAGGLALLLTLTFVNAWEAYWRSQGIEFSYNDDEPLWAYHRQRIYQASPAAPVIIGSSRSKFGIDLATWEGITGGAPTQLALVGTSPRPVLKDLADDPNFKGAVLVDVTEFLFFSPSGGPMEKSALSSLKFYPDWSLAQRASFHTNTVLESNLLFLDEEKLALRFLIDRIGVPNRPGVFVMPPVFPLKFTTNAFNRQTFITDAFVADTAMQNEVKRVWYNLLTKAPKMPMTDSTLTQIISEVKANVAKIQARGGKVAFVRMPSTGAFRDIERQAFPREKYWDRLIRETGAPGIHFEDYPSLANYPCIEWSHLAPAEARKFTRDLMPILAQHAGWPLRAASQQTAALSSPTSTSR
jgi:hypothetical protein